MKVLNASKRLEDSIIRNVKNYNPELALYKIIRKHKLVAYGSTKNVENKFFEAPKDDSRATIHPGLALIKSIFPKEDISTPYHRLWDTDFHREKAPIATKYENKDSIQKKGFIYLFPEDVFVLDGETLWQYHILKPTEFVGKIETSIKDINYPILSKTLRVINNQD